MNQSDYRELNYQAAEDHSKRLQGRLIDIIKFFEEEDTNMMLHIVHLKKLDVSAIKKFIKQCS